VRNDPLRHAQKLEFLPTAQLRGYERNARLHSDAQVKQIAASISEFGFVNPLIIDEADVIIAGHGRLAASKSLGLAEVPCIRVSGLSDAQRRALILVDNKLALNATWDDKLLAEELKAVQDSIDLGDLEFDMCEVLGFSTEEFTDLMSVLTEGAEPEPDRTIEVSDEPAVCRAGETWIFGLHRLTIGRPVIARDANNISQAWERATPHGGEAGALRADL